MQHASLPRWWSWLGLVVLVALGLRLGRWVEERAGPQARAPAGDEGTYDRWAQRIARGEQPPEVPYMAPLQAWSLAAWHRVLPPGRARDAQRLLQVLLGVGTVLVAWGLGRTLAARHGPDGRLRGGHVEGAIAAAAVATHLPLIYCEATLLRDGPATFLTACAAAALLVFLRSGPGGAGAPPAWRGLALGVVWGVAALARENLLLVGGGVVLALLPWALRAAPGRPRTGRVLALGAVGLGLLLPLLPLLRANAHLEGRWEPLPTWNGGCVFYLSNRAEVEGATYQPPAFVQQATPEGEQAGFRTEAQRRAGRRLTPHEISRYWLGQGVREVVAAPGRYAKRVVQRAAWFVASGELVHARDPLLDARDSLVLRLPTPGFGLLVGLALVGVLAGRAQPGVRALAAVCLLLLLSTVAVAFASRYRLPAVPLLAALGALGARESVRALRRGRPGLLLLGVAVGLACTWIPVPYVGSQAAIGRLNRALTWMELHEPARAFAELEALPGGEQAAGAWTRLAGVLLQNDELALARAAGEHAVEQAPWHAPAWLFLGLSLERGAGPGAEAALARAVALDPGLHEGWRALARCRARRGDEAGAAAAAARAAQRE